MKDYSGVISKIRKEISKIVIGQDIVVDGLIRGLLANGHVLVEGVPGIAKTLIILALAKSTGGVSNRIQFTVDLLPSDIVGITTYTQGKGFSIVKGPVFANFIVADEINRSPPKTQSALLEAMQEKKTTIGKQTFELPSPFFVMATMNPIESSGTYPLPEAQIDRFLFKIMVDYPSNDEMKQIIERNITLAKFEDFGLKSVTTPAELVRMQQETQKIKHSDKIKDYIVRLTDATHQCDKYNIKTGKYIAYGCSPRAAIGMFIAAKADAMMRGNSTITPQHIKNVAHDVMRHRILLNYQGQAEKITTDKIVEEILTKVPIP